MYKRDISLLWGPVAPWWPDGMPSAARALRLLGRRVAGLLVFTLVYIASLASFRVFLHQHPEARGPILWLAVLTSLVYMAGVVILALYYREE